MKEMKEIKTELRNDDDKEILKSSRSYHPHERKRRRSGSSDKGGERSRKDSGHSRHHRTLAGRPSSPPKRKAIKAEPVSGTNSRRSSRHHDRSRSPPRHRTGDRGDDDKRRAEHRDREREKWEDEWREREQNDAKRREARGGKRAHFYPSVDGNQKPQFDWGKKTEEDKAVVEEEDEEKKEKPNFGLSGKLTADTNLFNGVVIKYNEPPEARKPKLRWRLYPFKGDEALPVIYVHRQSAYLIGNNRRIADIPVDHPSCSKQHAALQYRVVSTERDDGTVARHIRPYIIDLGSSNGTFLNNQVIDPQRYYELQEKDVVKFGYSTREYVILHENSLAAQESGSDDDSDPQTL